jgi:hypothetical protein
MADRSGTEQRIMNRDPSSLGIFSDEEQLDEQEEPDNSKNPKEQEDDEEDGLVSSLENDDDDEPTENVQLNVVQSCAFSTANSYDKKRKRRKNRLTRLWMKTPSNCLESPTRIRMKKWQNQLDITGTSNRSRKRDSPLSKNTRIHQLPFKVNLVWHYKDTKSNGFSDKHIVRLMPETKAVVEALANSSSDGDKEK